MITFLTNLLSNLSARSNFLQSLSLLALRLWMAKIFFLSGLVKVQSWPSTLALFADEYKVPLLPPDIAAYMGTTAELVLPLLLIIGLLTPFAALGLIGMTLVIELFVYPGTTEHYYWLLILGVLLAHGGGKFSVDKLLLNRFSKQ